MTNAMADRSTVPPGVDHSVSLLRAARIGWSVSAAAAPCRIILAVMRSDAAGGRTLSLVGAYGAIVMIAVALRWGIARRTSIARWSAVLAGALMGWALVVGRAEFGIFWHNLPMPPIDALLFPARLLTLLGFVVAGLCCAVAPFDVFRGREASPAGDAA
jgi:hypothetical protein